jgi:Fe-S-cluster containining protein
MADLYEWIDEQLRQNPDKTGQCSACGACCDFPAYDHRLYVTPPELVYLAAQLKTSRLERMLSGRCPYQQGQSCTVREHRFAACRIFCCRGDSAFQSELSEAAIQKLKAICERFEVPYRYQDLACALETFNDDAQST